MKKFKERAIDYFNRHPESNECHITSDSRVFHTIGSAQGMAGTLDDQKIESYLRKVLEKEGEFENEDESGTKPSDAEILAMTVFLQKSEVEKLDYNDLKKLVKFFNVEAENQKAPTLIEALNKLKETFNQK
ncbi:hypothetical protein SAMN05421786_11539 [Chryseobacterium ureilyticum]|uniref:Uncharacterized protein n=1 Tax=Chryseobacterium ureilyticum TaxID=373668 RepID=A0A1N7QRV8_9FLAO|nr:hypothetical protein [Chryseobacterium ureilyticum]SIT25613.1 hypothetical protein SAMN05421786_11539 [Chryseobacterium ureilyticum]